MLFYIYNHNNLDITITQYQKNFADCVMVKFELLKVKRLNFCSIIICMCFAWKDHPWNDLYYVGRMLSPIAISNLVCWYRNRQNRSLAYAHYCHCLLLLCIRWMFRGWSSSDVFAVIWKPVGKWWINIPGIWGILRRAEHKHWQWRWFLQCAQKRLEYLVFGVLILTQADDCCLLSACWNHVFIACIWG